MQHFRSLLAKSMETGSRLLRCESSTLFLNDDSTGELWSVVIQDSEIAEIRLPSDKGIAGACFTSRMPINSPDAYRDPRFLREIDEKSGFHTRSLLAVPVLGRDGKAIGVLEAVNKKTGEAFSDDDTRILTQYAADVADVVSQSGRRSTFIPGAVAVAAVTALAFVLHGLLPGPLTKGIGVVLVGVLLGMVVSNVFTLPIKCEPGIRFALHNLLRVAIVLLGARVAFGDVATIGGKAMVMIVILMLAALAVAHLLARVLKVPVRLATLIGIGGAICGNTAIAATAPVIHAREEHFSMAIAVNTLLGTTAMFLYPLLGAQLGMTDAFFGAWVGVAVNDTAQVVATAFSMSPQSGEIATVVKLTRNALLGVVIVLVGLSYAKWVGGQIGGKPVPLRTRLKQSVPFFLLGFLAMALLNTLGVFVWLSDLAGRSVQNDLKFLTDILIVAALTGVGLGTKFASLRAVGIAPVVIGVSVSLTIAVLGFVLIRVVGLAA